MMYVHKRLRLVPEHRNEAGEAAEVRAETAISPGLVNMEIETDHQCASIVLTDNEARDFARAILNMLAAS